MRTVRFGLAVCAALLATVLAPSAAPAADVFFPSASPPATQITREFSLKEAARRGLIKLTPKGGIEGDQVAVELQHKKVSGPITVTLHVEFTVKPRVSEEERQDVRDKLPDYEQKTADELNRGRYKTASGDPIKFKVDYKFRNPDETPRYNHHQILIVDPLADLDAPDPDFRDSVADLGTPNKDGAAQEGTFSSLSLSQPGILSHELLHLAGLDDRYHDVYRVKGKDYPLPRGGPEQGGAHEVRAQPQAPAAAPARRRRGQHEPAGDQALRHHGHRRQSELPQAQQARPQDRQLARRRAGGRQPGRPAAQQGRLEAELRHRVPHDRVRRARLDDGGQGHRRLLHRPFADDPLRGRVRRPRPRERGAGLRAAGEAAGVERGHAAVPRRGSPGHVGRRLEHHGWLSSGRPRARPTRLAP